MSSVATVHAQPVRPLVCITIRDWVGVPYLPILEVVGSADARATQLWWRAFLATHDAFL
jgi:hypothetical protein